METESVDLAGTRDEGFVPSPPDIGWEALKEQLWMDIFGKEVQSAATYSYMWIAIQVSHMCLGIIFYFVLYLLLDYSFGREYSGIIGFCSLVIICMVFCYWEWRAYSDSVNRAQPLFPLNRKGLANNAIIAAFYMCIGSFVAMSFLWGMTGNDWEGLVLFIFLFLCCLAPAPYWLKQKIIWQKAGFPYLFRLANISPIIDQDTAEVLQKQFIEQALPPQSEPLMVIVHGPILAERTKLAVGIGCEMAFKASKVRYMTFDKLIELIGINKNSPGPRNINYWDWRNSQVLIIDDISPFFDPMTGKNLELFTDIINSSQQGVNQLASVHVNSSSDRICNGLGDRHTVWVLGDEDPDAWKKKIKQFCQNTSEPIMVQVGKEAKLKGNICT